MLRKGIDMTEVKDVMNDVYLSYKKYKADGDDMKAWDKRMEELEKKYHDDNFFKNLSFTFSARIIEERIQSGGHG